MSENSKIEWTHHSFNPWWGCAKVSPGCDHCYAERDAGRFTPGKTLWGVSAERREFGDKHWNEPLRWNKKAQEAGERHRVFCASMADVFDKNAPEGARERLWQLIEATPHLDWLLLTKRIGNVSKMIPDRWIDGLPRNIWLGASIVNQEEADRDIPKLLSIKTLGVRFLSMEPLLGPVDLLSTDYLTAMHGKYPFQSMPDEHRTKLLHMIDWVIVGGESGPHARPMHPHWAQTIRDQCASAGVPFLFKQWGEWVPRISCYHTFEDGMSCADFDPGNTVWPCIRLTEAGHNGRDLAHSDGGCDAYMSRVGKKVAGRLLNGRTHDEFPILEQSRKGAA